jgi:hypothetical protein
LAIGYWLLHWLLVIGYCWLAFGDSVRLANHQYPMQMTNDR